MSRPWVEAVDAAGAALHQTAWQALATRCLEPNVFGEPGFVIPAMRHLPGGAQVRAVLVWQGEDRGSLIGTLVVRRSWPVLSTKAAWLHPQATSAFPLLDRDHAETALVAMLTFLGAMGRRGSPVLLSGLPEREATAGLLRSATGLRLHVVERRVRAVLRRREAGSATIAVPKEVRRQERRLEEKGPLSLVSAEADHDVERAVEDFIALEGKGWKGRRGTAFASSAASAAFVREAARQLSRSGQCRIETLKVGDKPAASAIVLRSRDRCFFWKTAFDETLRPWSPGVQLTYRLTAWQLQDPGLAWTDSCALPNHPMIDRVWPERMEVVDILVAPHQAEAALRRTLWIERVRRDAKALAKRAALAFRRS